jgi:hypothetical protein
MRGELPRADSAKRRSSHDGADGDAAGISEQDESDMNDLPDE